MIPGTELAEGNQGIMKTKLALHTFDQYVPQAPPDIWNCLLKVRSSTGAAAPPLLFCCPQLGKVDLGPERLHKKGPMLWLILCSGRLQNLMIKLFWLNQFPCSG